MLSDPPDPDPPDPDSPVADPPDADGGVDPLVGADNDMKLLVNVVAQVTALPPPVPVPLHWLTVTGSADVPPVTVQPTVVSPL